jgi:hypothetical protein
MHENSPVKFTAYERSVAISTAAANLEVGLSRKLQLQRYVLAFFNVVFSVLSANNT